MNNIQITPLEYKMAQLTIIKQLFQVLLHKRIGGGGEREVETDIYITTSM